MRTSWTLLRPCFLGLVAVLGLLVAADTPTSTLSTESRRAVYERIDHDAHIALAGPTGCARCHDFQPVLDAEGEVDPVATMLPRVGACHACHDGELPRKERGPPTCSTCHDTPPAPVSHGAGWLSLHGAEARLVGTKSCSDCHKSRTCVDCHERKESLGFEAHDRAWLSVHGIAAQADPSSCTSCHLQASCTGCHATAQGRTP